MAEAFDPIKADLRTMMLAQAGLPALIGERITPQFPYELADPVYPMVTLARKGGGTDSYHISDDTRYTVHVWSKENNDQLWAIYNLIRPAIDLQELPNISTCLLKQVDVTDDLYEPDTRTYHLAAIYAVRVIP